VQPVLDQRRWLDQRLRVALMTLVALATVLVPLLPATAAAQDDLVAQLPDDLQGAITEDGRVEVLYFGSITCPFCQQMELYLQEVEERYSPPLDVVKHEVSRDAEARERWEQEVLARGQTPSGVPTTIIGDRVYVGFSPEIGRDITRVVDRLTAVVTATEASEPDPSTDPGTGLEPDEVETSIEVPVVGEVELTDRSAVGVTALIAFVDGFNPCSLWVLAILLAMVLNAGATRIRVLAVGATFLTVTAAIYGLFIVGIFTVVDLLSSITAITVIVGLIALLIGGVNIKDYFAYRQGLSFTISDRYKPRIYKGGRAIRNQDRGLLPVLGTTVALAAGVAIIELPCTMGFPVVWTGTLQTLGIGRGTEFGALLGLYLLIYLLDELILFAIVVITLQVARVEEKHGRALKLIGGSLMVVLGAAMIAVPSLLEDLTGLLLLTLAAVVLMGVLVLINRARTSNGRNAGDGGDGGDGPEAGLPRTPTSPGATSGRH
jgi:cytochrome c biogenesis protein CcdA/glutaredoxin